MFVVTCSIWAEQQKKGIPKKERKIKQPVFLYNGKPTRNTQMLNLQNYFFFSYLFIRVTTGNQLCVYGGKENTKQQ